MNPGEGSMDRYLATRDGKLHKLWQDDGLLSMRWEGIVRHPLGMLVPVVLVELTEKGKSDAAGTPNSGFIGIKMCEQQFDRITGIEISNNDTAAKVEYTWKLANLTPFGKRQNEVLGQGAFCGNLASQADSILMSLYDDGWRVAQ
jgi:hypothetical protein